MNPGSKLIAALFVLVLASCGTTSKPSLVPLYRKGDGKNPVALVNPQAVPKKSDGELPVLAPATDWKDSARVIGRIALRVLWFSIQEQSENRK